MAPCVHSDRLYSRFESRTIASPRSPSVTLRNRFPLDFERRIARASRTITHLQNNPCSHNLPVFHSLHRLKPATSGIMVRFRTREPHNLCAGRSLSSRSCCQAHRKALRNPNRRLAPIRSGWFERPAREILASAATLSLPAQSRAAFVRIVSGKSGKSGQNPTGLTSSIPIT